MMDLGEVSGGAAGRKRPSAAEDVLMEQVREGYVRATSGAIVFVCVCVRAALEVGLRG